MCASFKKYFCYTYYVPDNTPEIKEFADQRDSRWVKALALNPDTTYDPLEHFQGSILTQSQKSLSTMGCDSQIPKTKRKRFYVVRHFVHTIFFL